MQPDTTRVAGNGGSLGHLPEMVNPVWEHLEDTARDFAQALARAGESAKQIRVADLTELMRRSPLTALAVAAGIGFFTGLFLWAREK